MRSYFDVEPRYVDLQDGCFTLTPERAVALVDERTIAVAAMCVRAQLDKAAPMHIFLCIDA